MICVYCGELYLQETSVHVKNTTDVLRMALINTKFAASLIIKHKKLQAITLAVDSPYITALDCKIRCSILCPCR